MTTAEIILHQIQTIRRNGGVNLFDTERVIEVAEQLGFEDLVDFVPTIQYYDFLMTGDKDMLPK